MKRTTIMADEELLSHLRAIADREQISLAEVIRQGLELRAARPGRRLRFIGAGASSEEADDMARRTGDIEFEPPSWR